MASSSIQGGERAAERAPGRDVDALGPSDNSDSGSDSLHERRMPTEPDNPSELGATPVHGNSTSDMFGTGERASAAGDDEDADGRDIAPDRIGRRSLHGGDAAAEIDSLAADDAPDREDADDDS